MVIVPQEAMATGNDYLKPDYVEEHDLTCITITGEGSVQSTDWEGKTSTRMVVPISYEGQVKDESPQLWSMNPKSARTLSTMYGEDTSKWVGKTVEITVAGVEKMRHILVDAVRTRRANKMTQTNIDPDKEASKQ